MTILDRYLANRFLFTLFRALLAFVLLYVLVDLLTHRRDNIIENDVPWNVVVRYYVLLTPQIIANYIAPFAVLVAGLLVVGEAAQNNEVTAALASGISMRRLVRMPILATLAFSAAIFALSEYAGPYTSMRSAEIEHNFFTRNPASKREGVSWADLSGGWTCHIEKFNRLALTGEGVLMYAFHGDALQMIQVDRIFWEPSKEQWLIEDGVWLQYSADFKRRHLRRVTQAGSPIDEKPADLFTLERAPETKSAESLRKDILWGASRGLDVTQLWVAYYSKFAQPALTFVMIWLAIPFALRLRRGGLAIGFGMSVAIAVAYILLFYVSTGLGLMGQLSPVVAVWLANGLFFATGLVLFVRSPT